MKMSISVKNMMIVRDIRCICILLHICTLSYQSVECALVIKPKDDVVLSGGFVTLHCASDRHVKGIIVWKTSNPGSPDRDFIFNRALAPSVSSYISVTDSGDGNCNLNINASLAAAKKYICIESTTDVEASAELIVLEHRTNYTAPEQTKDESVNTSCSVVSTSRPNVGLLVECQPKNKGLHAKRNEPAQAPDDSFRLIYSILFAGNWVPSIECEERNTFGGRVLQGKPTTISGHKAVTFTWNLTNSNEWTDINCSTKFRQSENISGNAFPALPYRYIRVPLSRPPPPPPPPPPSPSTDHIGTIILLAVLLVIVVLFLCVCVCCLRIRRCGLNDWLIKNLQGCLRHLQGCYLIVNKLTGQALVVQETNPNSGTRVLTQTKNGEDNQLWYDDLATGTIRSKLNNFCLEVENSQLVVKPFKYGDLNQQWERRGSQITNRYNPNEVLDIVGLDKNQGAEVTRSQAFSTNITMNTRFGRPVSEMILTKNKINFGTSQSWSFELPRERKREEFYIVSEFNGKVLDIKGGRQVIMSPKGSKEATSQLWYIDPQDFIRSALNDFVFTAKDGRLDVKPFKQRDLNVQLVRRGNQITNPHNSNEVLDIIGLDKNQGAAVTKNQASSTKKTPLLDRSVSEMILTMSQCNGDSSQSWSFESLGGRFVSGFPAAQPTSPSAQQQSKDDQQVSEKNGNVLDIKEGCQAPSAEVIVSSKDSKDQNKDDQQVSEKNGNVLDIKEGCQAPSAEVIVSSKDSKYQNKDDQQVSEKNGNVLDIKEGCQAPSAEVIVSSKDSIDQKEEFYIVSEENGKVFDIKGGCKDTGAQVILSSKGSKEAKSQLWYFDPQGFIRSALNNFVFTTKSGQCIKMAAADGEAHSQWRFDGDKVVNQAGDVLDICRANSSDEAEICAYKEHRKENQRWKMEHA